MNLKERSWRSLSKAHYLLPESSPGPVQQAIPMNLRVGIGQRIIKARPTIGHIQYLPSRNESNSQGIGAHQPPAPLTLTEIFHCKGQRQKNPAAAGQRC